MQVISVILNLQVSKLQHDMDRLALTLQVMPHLVSCHDVGLHMGILAACCSQVSIQEGALTADG